MVKDPTKVNFSYRDNLWRGSDLLATGIASFGHISGVHYQNRPEWEDYCGMLEAGQLPLGRGMRLTERQRLIRELILQLEAGLSRCQLLPEQIWLRRVIRMARGMARVRARGVSCRARQSRGIDAGRVAPRRRPAAGFL